MRDQRGDGVFAVVKHLVVPVRSSSIPKNDCLGFLLPNTDGPTRTQQLDGSVRFRPVHVSYRKSTLQFSTDTNGVPAGALVSTKMDDKPRFSSRSKRSWASKKKCASHTVESLGETRQHVPRQVTCMGHAVCWFREWKTPA